MSVFCVFVTGNAFSSVALACGPGLTDVQYVVADIAMSQKLQEELKYEQESVAESPETPEFLKQFLEQGVWSVRNHSFASCFLRLIEYIAD